MDDTTMENPDDDSLVRRRSRRSTAGNRMEAALAEMAALHPEPEVEEEDKDFDAIADEEEIFDSDFASTDEEQEADDVGEQALINEEKAARRQSRRHPPRPALVQRGPKPVNGISKAKTRLRISVNFAKDIEDASPSTSAPRAGPSSASTRTSRRTSTIQASQSLQSKLQLAESKRLTLPKRAREAEPVYTQAELLARALDTEEGNIASHRGYLAAEEEKRRRAKVVRKAIDGPKLRWISRAEEQETEEETQPPPAPSNLFSTPGLDAILTLSNAQQTGPENRACTKQKVKVNKNYLVHELGQHQGVHKPGWEKSMRAIFGDHIDWEELRVYSGRHRPLSRPVARCPITGLLAPYRDPRSGVPYANAEAFKMLTQILAHEFVWNEDLHCYTSSEKSAQVVMDDEDELDPVNGASTAGAVES